jgi:D-3-phosphoglycerate dehydrogenase
VASAPAGRPSSIEPTAGPVVTDHLVVLLDSYYPEHSLERGIIEEVGGSFVYCNIGLRDEEHVLAQPLLSQAEVVLTDLAPVTARVLRQAASCRLVARYGVGFDNVDVAAATAEGIWVANVPDYATDSVADHAIMLLLTVARQLRFYVRRLEHDGWRQPDDPYLNEPDMFPAMSGRVLGIVGFGRIGRAVGRRAHAMGMHVLAYDPFVSPGEIGKDGAESADFETVLSQSDFVSLHCPLTEQTYHMIARDALAKMRPGVIIVNTARGDVVNLACLADALRTGHVRGAGLDVWDREPLPPGHPLRTHPAVVATPHVAYLSDKSVRALREGVARNAAAVLKGGPPLHLVNDPPSPRPRASG